MKCTLCHGDHIAKSMVQERIPVGNDIVLVPIEVLVCQSCGERFYDRATLHRLEDSRTTWRPANVPFARSARYWNWLPRDGNPRRSPAPKRPRRQFDTKRR